MTNALADYSGFLIAASYVLALIGMFVGMFASQHVRDDQGQASTFWAIMCSLVLVGFMWATHFIGILAYQPDVPMTFGVQKSILSFVMPLIFCIFAVLVVLRQPGSKAVLVVGALTMTMGLFALHYGGMAAMRVPAEITHSPGMVVFSVVITILTSTAALFLLFSETGRVRILAMPVMALAVCAIHYSGMAAMVPVPNDKTVAYFSAAVSPSMLVNWVVTSVFALTLLALFLGITGNLIRESRESPEA